MTDEIWWKRPEGARKIPGTAEQRAHRSALHAALLSGEYTQARQALRNDSGFCCLGVACDISGMGEWEPASDSDFEYQIGTHEGNTEYLPHGVADWLGFQHEGDFAGERLIDPEDQIHYSLAQINDAGFGFEVIAAVIEEWFELSTGPGTGTATEASE